MLILILFPFCLISWDPDDTKYDVSLTKEPILARQIDESHEFYMWNKYEQKFICSLPYRAKSAVSSSANQDKINATVEEFFKSLQFLSMCIHMETGGWWTYKLCFRENIFQFHHDGDKLVVEYSLGKFSHDRNWTVEELNTVQNETNYHEQYYTDGTACDLNDQPRTATVKFFCDPKIQIGMELPREVSSCNYELIVKTSVLCRFRAFQPLEVKNIVKINCQPTLSAEELVLYQQKEKEKPKTAIASPKTEQKIESPDYEGQTPKTKTILANIGGKEYKLKVVQHMGRGESVEKLNLENEEKKYSSTPPVQARKKTDEKVEKPQDSKEIPKKTGKSNLNEDEIRILESLFGGKTIISSDKKTESADKVDSKSSSGGEQDQTQSSDESSMKETITQKHHEAHSSSFWNNLFQSPKSSFEEEIKNYQFNIYDEHEVDDEEENDKKPAFHEGLPRDHAPFRGAAVRDEL